MPKLVATYDSRRSLYRLSNGHYDMWHDGWCCKITALNDDEAVERFAQWCYTKKEYITVIA